MIAVSKKQTFERWDILPDDIREALVSEETSDFLRKTCEEEHIPEDKIKVVARLAGYVLFGFLHVEDLAAELRDALKIDIRIATAIANAINQRIFLPLREQIELLYKKPINSSASSVSIGVGPKILEEIRPVVPVGARPISGPAFPQVGWSSSRSVSSTAFSQVSGIVLPPKPPIFGNLQKTESGKIPLPPRAESKIQNPESGRSAAVGMNPPGLSPQVGGASVAGPVPIFMGSDAATRPITKIPDFMMKSGDRIAALTAAPPKPIAKPAIIEFGIPKPPVQESRNQNLESSRDTERGNSPIIPQPSLPPRPPGK